MLDILNFGAAAGFDSFAVKISSRSSKCTSPILRPILMHSVAGEKVASRGVLTKKWCRTVELVGLIPQIIRRSQIMTFKCEHTAQTNREGKQVRDQRQVCEFSSSLPAISAWYIQSLAHFDTRIPLFPHSAWRLTYSRRTSLCAFAEKRCLLQKNETPYNPDNYFFFPASDFLAARVPVVTNDRVVGE